MSDLDAFIRKEQNDLADTSDGSSLDDNSCRETNFMSALRRDIRHNNMTYGSKKVYPCIFEKRATFHHSELGTENRI